MSDTKTAINWFSACAAFMLFLMAIDYVGAVQPELLPKFFLLDMLAPLAFQHSYGVRLMFIGFSMGYFIYSPSSEMQGAEIASDSKIKFRYLIIFLASLASILISHRYPLLLFKLLYPVTVISFCVSGFIVANLFKKKNKTLGVFFGFERVDKKVGNEDSFHWYSEKDGWINIENIFQHILILGGAGSGKSFTLIQPIIEQAFQKYFAMMIFDFKMNANFSKKKKDWALTRFAYKCYLKYSKATAKKDAEGNWIGEGSIENDRRRFWVINFRDPRYSHRVNTIHPRYMESEAFANEFSLALLQNLKPEWNKNKDFFAESAILYLKAIFWFLKEEFPEYCTIPHAASISMIRHTKVLAMLSLNKSCSEIISSINVAEEKNADGQIAGVVASLQSLMSKIQDKSIYWVLSGDDFSLRLNDPENPGILCLGSDPQLQETLSPVAALIATVVRKEMNRPDQLKSLLILDELPQLMIPNLHNTLAVSRSNNLGVVAVGQDVSQFEINYGKEQTNALLANCNNIFVGMVNDLNTAKTYSEMIGSRDKENKSINSGKSLGDSASRNTGENIGLQKEALIHPYQIMTLQRGRFVGKVALVNEEEPYSSFFNVRPKIESFDIEHNFPMIVKRDDESSEMSEFEMKTIMDRNFINIKRESMTLVDNCARVAVVKGTADETKVFPKHFLNGKRIISADGQPLVRGITYDPETGGYRGKPILDDEDSQLQASFQAVPISK